MMRPVIDNIEELSAEWLSAALDREVRHVTAERIGTGQTGATYRLELDGERCPPTLVAKIAAGDEEARTRVRGGYRCEVGFYQHIAPTVDVCTPRCWYAAMTQDALGFTLLLDDLAPMTPGVQADGCTVEQASVAIRNLAALHAPRWNDASLFELDFLGRPTERHSAFLGALAVEATEAFVARYRAALDPADISTLRLSAEAVTAWLPARLDPFAVIHGDYRLDNLLFPASDGDVVAVDWQTLTVGPPARDLAYFLGTSLRIDDRRAGEDRLVTQYHQELVERGVRGYDAAQCFDDYRLGQLQGPMVTTIGSAYAAGATGPATDAMFLAMAQRSCASIRDLGSLDAL